MSRDSRTTNVMGVRFASTGRLRYFDAGDREFQVGDRVAIELDGKRAEGEVVIAPGQVLYSELKAPLEPVTIIDAGP